MALPRMPPTIPHTSRPPRKVFRFLWRRAIQVELLVIRISPARLRESQLAGLHLRRITSLSAAPILGTPTRALTARTGIPETAPPLRQPAPTLLKFPGTIRVQARS